MFSHPLVNARFMLKTAEWRFDFPCSFPTFHPISNCPPTTAGTLDKRYPNRPRASVSFGPTLSFRTPLCTYPTTGRISNLLSSSLPRERCLFSFIVADADACGAVSLCRRAQNLYRRILFSNTMLALWVWIDAFDGAVDSYHVAYLYPSESDSLRRLFVFVAIVSHWLPQRACAKLITA